MFPGKRLTTPRLQNLYQTANWWPKTAVKPPSAPKPAAGGTKVIEEKPTPPTGRTGSYTVETLRDLTKISEINQKIFRQQTPRAMLNTTVNEVGAYMKAARTFSVIGAPGRPAEMAAEHCHVWIAAGAGGRRWCFCWRRLTKRFRMSWAG